ncbi:cell division protein FtsA [Rickettsia endosymbiont of Cardiosporidium cionae]|uniref:cell division protein FtsA n=1 Tax=Rickettsia endosymbiont of Cardiosporidium cionae TaxID=2777155 RepID=UPI0018949DC6|nr:cell division protein FtsA [Rickettsia endosymbiont of Cardiosporidium cionae]KAF8818893.1 cell division protein FtsA [Rickettsia endosymbiont of Cardiosporidium cionae]
MKLKAKHLVMLDIGSSKIAAISAYINKNDTYKVTSNILHASKGFRLGRIINMEFAESSIIKIIYSLEKESNRNIKEVTISLSSALTKSYYVSHNMKLGSSAMTKQDIKKLINKALNKFQLQGKEIIHYFPLEFILDNNLIESPIGMYGKEISCKLHLVVADSTILMNFIQCFAKCHIEINKFIVSSYASALSCLDDEEKKLGAILIDIGSHVTCLSVFFNNNAVYFNHVPIGGWHITEDIARQFAININAAEKIKILYGQSIVNNLYKDHVIRLDDFDNNNAYTSNISITSTDLAKVIHNKMHSILQKIQTQYNQIDIDNLIARKIVLTGGGACLQKVKNLVADVFNKQVRIASPNLADIDNQELNFNPQVYSCIMGMLKYYRNQYNKNYIDYTNNSDNMFKSVYCWIKENI